MVIEGYTRSEDGTGEDVNHMYIGQDLDGFHYLIPQEANSLDTLVEQLTLITKDPEQVEVYKFLKYCKGGEAARVIRIRNKSLVHKVISAFLADHEEIEFEGQDPAEIDQSPARLSGQADYSKQRVIRDYLETISVDPENDHGKKYMQVSIKDGIYKGTFVVPSIAFLTSGTGQPTYPASIYEFLRFSGEHGVVARIKNKDVIRYVVDQSKRTLEMNNGQRQGYT